MTTAIPFNRPSLLGSELDNIRIAHANGALSGDGAFSHYCEKWLAEHTGAARALVTHSCTGALEMAAILIDLKPGDEVIMPSYTFVSTANAVVLRGATPVFVDIRPDTMNLDEKLIEAAITPKTRAIFVVHYAGVACEMDAINEIAQRRGLEVVEDAAQGLGSSYRGRPLGGLGGLAAFSFHETKNITCGEGGALIINDKKFVDAAEVIHQKGTDRRRFIRGLVDKYTWRAAGSSFLLGEMAAAFLAAQLDHADEITAARLAIWRRYHEALAGFEASGWIKRPTIPAECEHNAHMYYVLLDRRFDRDEVISALRAEGVYAVFHYVPLHSSEAGLRYGRAHGELRHTDDCSARLLRLPFWTDMLAKDQETVIDAFSRVLRSFA